VTYAVGSLVKARGRELVDFPESEDDMLVLRPLGGTEDEVAGIYLPLEPVEPVLGARLAAEEEVNLDDSWSEEGASR
jgi:hypothetical protein